MQRTYTKARFYAKGLQVDLFGCKEDDANALDHLLNELEEKVPKALILGGIASTDMAYFKLGNLKYFSGP